MKNLSLYLRHYLYIHILSIDSHFSHIIKSPTLSDTIIVSLNCIDNVNKLFVLSHNIHRMVLF
jgi:hypothetical protein